MTFTNCTSIDNGTETIDAYLQHLQDQTNITMIPAVTMLCLFAVTGLVGNTLVLIVYSKKQGINATKILILTIASYDIVANVCAIPIAIYTMLDTWNFQHALLCKVTASMGSFTALGGAMSLLVVAFIRYRKVCTPYEWQVTVKEAAISSVVTAVLAVVFSVPYFLLYGVKTRQTPCPNIQGSECFADDKSYDTIWPLVNNALFVMLYLFLSVSLVVLYVLVGKAARGHTKHNELSAYNTQALRSIAATNTAKHKELITYGGVSSTDTQETSVINEESIHHGRIKDLYCCCNHLEEQNSQNDTQPSMNPKTYSTNTRDEHVTANLQSATEIAVADARIPGVMSDLDVSRYKTQRSLSSPNVSPDYSSKINVPDRKMYLQTKAGHLSNNKQLFNTLLDNASQRSEAHTKHDKQEPVSQHSSPSLALSERYEPDPMGAFRRHKTSGYFSRITIMLIIISSIYVLGYLPFLIQTIFKKLLPEKYYTMNVIEQSIYNLFYRLYFLNSAANPIIYTFCDMRFRHDCLKFIACRNKKAFATNSGV